MKIKKPTTSETKSRYPEVPTPIRSTARIPKLRSRWFWGRTIKKLWMLRGSNWKQTGKKPSAKMSKIRRPPRRRAQRTCQTKNPFHMWTWSGPWRNWTQSFPCRPPTTTKSRRCPKRAAAWTWLRRRWVWGVPANPSPVSPMTSPKNSQYKSNKKIPYK